MLQKLLPLHGQEKTECFKEIKGFGAPGRRLPFLAVAVRELDILARYLLPLPMRFLKIYVRAPRRRDPIRLTQMVLLHMFPRMAVRLEMNHHLPRLLHPTGLPLTVTLPAARCLRPWI